MKLSVTILLLATLTSQMCASANYLIKSVENNLFLKQSGGDFWHGDLIFARLSGAHTLEFRFEPAYDNPRFYHIARNTGLLSREYVNCDPPENGTVCYVSPFVDLNLRQKFEFIDLDGQTMFSDPDSGLVLTNEKDVLKLVFPTGGKDQRFIVSKDDGP